METRFPTQLRRGRVRPQALIGAVILALVILGLGVGGPFSRDDFLSLERIGDVAQRGHWLVIHDTYPEFHYQMARDAVGFVSRKPPLFFWLCALTVKSTGRITELNARWVSLLAAVAVSVEVLIWTASYLGATSAWLAFAFLLGSYGFAARATVVLPDMLLTLFIFSSFCLIYPLLSREEAGEKGEEPEAERASDYRKTTSWWHRRAVAAGLLLGLAILSKGPLPLVLCALAVFIYFVFAGLKPWSAVRQFWPWEILISALMLSAWWYAAEFVAIGGSALALFGVENFGAFLPPSLGGEGAGTRGFFYIELKIFSETLPLSILVPAFCLSLIARDKEDGVRAPLMFQLSLVVAVALFFSISSTKRDDYILPALPSLAILLAGLFAKYPSSDESLRPWVLLTRDVAVAISAAGSLLFIAGAVVLARGAVKFGPVGFQLQTTDAWYAGLFATGMRRLSIPFIAFLVAVAAAEIAVFRSLVRRSTPGMGAGLALLSIALVSLWTGVLRPELNRRRSLRLFAAEIFRQNDHVPVYYLEYPPREISFYAGRYIPQLPRSRAWCAGQGQPVYIILWQREAAGLSRKCLARLQPALLADDASADRPGLFELHPAGSNRREVREEERKARRASGGKSLSSLSRPVQ
jgi:4-amino-4-deoxy-L-arabinose transferase-like glycosyltransferase